MSEERTPQEGSGRQGRNEPTLTVPLRVYVDALRELASMEEEAVSRKARHPADDPGIRED